MADTKADTKKKDEPPKVPLGAKAAIGGTIPPSPPVDDVAESPVVVAPEPVEPPKGAYIEDLTGGSDPQVGVNDPTGEPKQAAFSDEFQGVGGRFIVNPKTGERQEVYEKYLDADGKEQYRKAV